MALTRARAVSTTIAYEVLLSAIFSRAFCIGTSVPPRADAKEEIDPLLITKDSSLKARNELLTKRIIDLGITSELGICKPLTYMRMGTIIHGIEMRPDGGAKLVRAAGCSAKVLNMPDPGHVIVQLPSKEKKVMHGRCRATVGIVSNPGHGSRKLRKAGENRWRGIRPWVRGVAKNACDHPHGGGTGKSKSSGSFGRTSQTPWAKPTKCGYKTSTRGKRYGTKNDPLALCNIRKKRKHLRRMQKIEQRKEEKKKERTERKEGTRREKRSN